jgi:hypothetical protein
VDTRHASATVVQTVEDGELRAECAEFIARTRALSQRRNDIVHNLWIQKVNTFRSCSRVSVPSGSRK